MKIIAVFIPTRLHGFDVTVASLERQNLPEDTKLHVIVADELIDIRDVKDYFEKDFEITTFKKPLLPGNMRNLAASYNEAINIARRIEAFCLISLQDYIWIDENAIKDFVETTEKLDKDGINHLLTGVCHIASTPKLTKQFDLKNCASIFPTSDMAREKPTELLWRDCRIERFGAEELLAPTNPIEWEANWALISNKALYDQRLKIDESFDEGIAYENQDYAFLATTLGYEVYISLKNVAISFPHKLYWEKVHDEEANFTHINKQKISERYGVV